MNVTEAPLQGILIIEPKMFADSRGYFFEGYQQKRYAEFGIPSFVQDNLSHSKQHVIRGLHYQHPSTQGKLVGVTHGAVWDVMVDIRRKSPTFGQWFGIELDDQNHTQLYIPPGFAHGFCVLSPSVDFYYKCTDYYSPQHEHGIAWNDATLNIPWPTTTPILSDKDQTYPGFNEMPAHDFCA